MRTEKEWEIRQELIVQIEGKTGALLTMKWSALSNRDLCILHFAVTGNALANVQAQQSLNMDE